jgi:hypothetical protein
VSHGLELRSNRMPLHPDELEDAREALRAAGRDVDAFSFRYVAYPRLGCASGPPLADVIVTDATSGRSRTYPTAARPDWVARFSEDVAGGF